MVLWQKDVAFREQAESWLDWFQTQNKKPIPETSVTSIRWALNKWLVPNVGHFPLSEVGNRALKQLVTRTVGKLSPKSINTYVNMAKEVWESLVDEEGEPLYPVKQRLH